MTGTRMGAAAAALVLATAIGSSQQAQAQGAYAAAYNNIYQLNITSTDENGLNGPFYLLPPDFTTFTVVSSNLATLGGVSDPANPSNSDIAGGPVDALPAYGLGSVFPGAPPANNDLTLVGLAGNYSRSGAQVSSTAITQATFLDPIVPTGQPTQAWGVAEAYIASDGFAAASSLNGSTTGINTTIRLMAPAIINIDFQAQPFAYVLVDAGAAAGSTNAVVDTTFTITSGGTTVFDWQPDGLIAPGGVIPGGIETRDDLNLNTSVEVTAPGDTAFSNPGALFEIGNISPTAATGTFSARTNVLPAGIYTLSLDILQSVTVLAGAFPPAYDYGDNPDAGVGTGPGDYETTDADNGARHLIAGPYFGECVDADDGTLQDASAAADDGSTTAATGTCSGGDDEDGISLPGTMAPGSVYSLDISMPADASIEDCVVDGWIDFNANGVFTDAGEQVIAGLTVGAGSGAATVTFAVPPDVALGSSYSRFRCTRGGGTGPTGEEDNGEVEDYPVAFAITPDREIPAMGPGMLALTSLFLTLLAARFGRRR